MSYTVSAAYHTAIIDGESPQDFILVDREAPFNYLSAKDGDFVAGTPTIVRTVSESQDFTLGECPASTLSVTLANPYGDAIQFWSHRGAANMPKNVWARAAIGVRTNITSFQSVADTLRLDLFSDNDFEIIGNRLYIRNPEAASVSGKKLTIHNEFVRIANKRLILPSGRVVVTATTGGHIQVMVGGNGWIFLDPTWSFTSIHAVLKQNASYDIFLANASGSILKMNITSNISSSPTITTLSGNNLPNDPMIRKMQDIRQTVVYDSNGFPQTVRRYNGSICIEETWEYCPTGVYNVKYPKYNLHSAYIDITDAIDAISMLDVSLKTLAEENNIDLSSPAESIVNEACSVLGIPMRSQYSLSPYTVTVPEDAISADITCRQFLRWMGERAGHMWRVDPEGYLKEYYPMLSRGSANEPHVNAEHLVAGVQVYNEYIGSPEKLIVYYGEDQKYTSAKPGTDRTDYEKISGNPLFIDPEVEGSELPWPEWDELAFEPYQVIDCTSISADPSYGYGDIVYFDIGNTYVTYIMQETISFGIRATAHYIATGNDTRPDEKSATYTGVKVSQFSGQIEEAIEEAGLSVRNADVEYYKSTSHTELIGGTWSTSDPGWEQGKYIWSRTKWTKADGTYAYSDPACITGNTGQNGQPGADFNWNLIRDTETYATWLNNDSLYTVVASAPTNIISIADGSSDWAGGEQRTIEKPYAEIRDRDVTFSFLVKGNSVQTNESSFCIEIDLYNEPGESRQKYKITKLPFTLTDEWVRHKFSLSISDSFFTTGSGTPNWGSCLYRVLLTNYITSTTGKCTNTAAFQLKEIKLEIGEEATTWAPAKDDIVGVGLDQDHPIRELYYLSASSTTPSAPTSVSQIASTAVYEQWTSAVPEWTYEYQYYFTCSEVHYDDGTIKWTDPVGQNAYNTANSTASSAADTASNAVSTANAAIEVAHDAESAASETAEQVDALNNSISSIVSRLNDLDNANTGQVAQLAQDINDTMTALQALASDFTNLQNSALFQNFYVDSGGTHITFVDGNDRGEILSDGANIKFIVNGEAQALINAKGFIFRYGIITNALQIGDEDDPVGGTWTWTKAPSGHFRLVYKAGNGGSS